MRTTLLVLLAFTLAPYVRAQKITNVTHRERPHFKIITKSATYYYDVAGGGFSSMVDRDGNDWIGYQREPWGQYPASAASSYRGVPNFVFRDPDDGAGHPGHDQCESRVVGKNRIHTVSKSGNWAWTVTFFKDCARIQMLQTDPDHPYWFLYEGPPGGSWKPRSTFWATDLTGPSYELYDHYRGNDYEANHRYLLFGEDSSPYTLFMVQRDPDVHVDHVSYLGNEEIGALNSPDGMVVAGLGRGPGSYPLMQGPNTFYVGLTSRKITEPKGLLRVRKGITKLLNRRGR